MKAGDLARINSEKKEEIFFGGRMRVGPFKIEKIEGNVATISQEGERTEVSVSLLIAEKDFAGLSK